MKVVFATPSLGGPLAPYISSLESSLPLIKAAGWEEGYAQEIGNPYISVARASMARKALDSGADVIIFLDYDLSWDPKDLLTLLETECDVVTGTYRYKSEPESYMGGIFTTDDGSPIVRPDGALKAQCAPAGFLKVTANAIRKFAKAYPELLFGDPLSPSVDLFNHGAHNFVWWGEDYAFCRRWLDCGEDLWLVPNLNIHHHTTTETFKGNYHEYLLRLPGGSNHEESKDADGEQA